MWLQLANNTYILSCTVSELWVNVVYWSNYRFWQEVPLLVWTLKKMTAKFGLKKLETPLSCDAQHIDILNCLDVDHQCDRLTERWINRIIVGKVSRCTTPKGSEKKLLVSWSVNMEQELHNCFPRRHHCSRLAVSFCNTKSNLLFSGVYITLSSKMYVLTLFSTRYCTVFSSFYTAWISGLINCELHFHKMMLSVLFNVVVVEWLISSEKMASALQRHTWQQTEQMISSNPCHRLSLIQDENIVDINHVKMIGRRCQQLLTGRLNPNGSARAVTAMSHWIQMETVDQSCLKWLHFHCAGVNYELVPCVMPCTVTLFHSCFDTGSYLYWQHWVQACSFCSTSNATGHHRGPKWRHQAGYTVSSWHPGPNVLWLILLTIGCCL